MPISFLLIDKIKIYILLFYLLLQGDIYPQYFLNEPAPLQPGNYWIYQDYDGIKFSYRVTDSTVIIDSLTYKVCILRSQYGGISYHYNRLDTNDFYIRYNNPLFINPESKYFKGNAQLGESWTNNFSLDHIVYYKIIDTGTTKWNGNITKYKLLEINDSALVQQYQYWSDDFGLIQVMDFEGASNYLFACAINGKIYGDTTFTDINEKNNNIPKKFYLSQNYPNPFNPSTKIDYYIPKTGLVTLKIFDVLGREIITLINKEMRPGSYTFDFHANNLSSGVYIYILKASEFTDVKKMVLLR